MAPPRGSAVTVLRIFFVFLIVKLSVSQLIISQTVPHRTTNSVINFSLDKHLDYKFKSKFSFSGFAYCVNEWLRQNKNVGLGNGPPTSARRNTHRRRTLTTRRVCLPRLTLQSLLFLLAIAGDVELNPGPEVSMYYMNTRSIANRLPEVNTYFADNTDFDIVCMTETWQHSGVHQAEVFNDQSFIVYRADRTQAKDKKLERGGGVLIAVSSNLRSQHRPDFSSANSKFEIIWCQITVQGKHSLFLGCAYIPPSPVSESDIEALHN